LTSIDDPVWQMSSGEQAAIEGLLVKLRPRLAIEIGTAEGAAARRLAAWVEELHCFDLSPPALELPDNVVVHTGDSHELLPEALAGFTAAERNVDLAIIDGDHSAAGVRRDVEDLLDSPAVGRTLIVIHDTANERVRSGLDAVHFAAWPKVVRVHLDWVPGQLFREPGLEGELWYGLGLVEVDSSRTAYGEVEVFEQRYYPAAALLASGRAALGESRNGDPPRVGQPTELEDMRWELDHAQEMLERQREQLEGVLASPSWRLTAPLRSLKHRVAGLRRRLRSGRRSEGADRAGLG
jgi:Methyltransferase domain